MGIYFTSDTWESVKRNDKTQINIEENTKTKDAVNKTAEKLKKTAPIFTDETLELLWNWIEAKQNVQTQESLDSLKNPEFSKVIAGITHLGAYTKPQS